MVIAGDRGLAGGYNSNVLKQAAAEGNVVVLPIGKRSAEYFVHHEVPPVHAGGAAGGRCLGGRVLPAVPPDHRRLPQGRVRRGEDLLHPVRFHDDPDGSHHGGAAAVHRAHRAAEGRRPAAARSCTSPAARKYSARSSRSMWPVSSTAPCARAWPVSWPPAAPPWMPPPRTPVR